MSDPATADDVQAKVTAWIEREIGPVLRIERQSRWRPAWFVTAGSAEACLNVRETRFLK